MDLPVTDFGPGRLNRPAGISNLEWFQLLAVRVHKRAGLLKTAAAASVYYDTPTPLQQLATISVPEPRQQVARLAQPAAVSTRPLMPRSSWPSARRSVRWWA